MPAARIDLTGQRFARLVVLVRGPRNVDKTTWVCRCDCGNECVVRTVSLRGGDTRSCGCYKLQRISETQHKHGDTGSPLYCTWRTMRRRVLDPNDRQYPNYGARGITIAAEWLEFVVFKKWALENGYQRSLSIDRIDNDGPYCPENCRWADKKTQNRNKRTNHLLTYRGKTACISEHAEDHGMTHAEVRSRLKLGWTVERILETPMKRRSI
jgi:hypothetical protein